MGEEEEPSYWASQAHPVSGCETEDCSGAEGQVGEGEEGGLDSRLPFGVVVASLLEPP